jgi:hypothetical protein
VVRYDNSVAAGYPTDIGDVLCEDYDAPHGEVNIHTKFQVDVRGDSMVGANIESGDTLTVLAGVKPLDGDIVLAELDREYTVKAYFEDDEGERWLVPFNEDFKPIRLNGGRDIRILGRVIEVVKKSVRRSYRECERIVRRSRAKLAKKSPTREQQENAIRKVGELVKKGRQWYAVYRVLIDAESELVTKGDFDGFCRLVSLLLPGHAHLPVAQELQRWKGGRYRLTPEYEGRGLAQDRLFIYYAKDGKQRERSYLVWTQKGAEEIRRTLNIED